jgi:uncharacterized membrane protein
MLGSVLTTGSCGIVLWLITATYISAVAALRETSLIFASMLGMLLLIESMGGWRIGGTMFVTLGAMLIQWGRSTAP